MTIQCEKFGKQIDDGDYPCQMCYCGGNDGQQRKDDFTCNECTWDGCSHPECPVNGCIDHCEDKCQHEDNFGNECPGFPILDNDKCPRAKNWKQNFGGKE